MSTSEERRVVWQEEFGGRLVRQRNYDRRVERLADVPVGVSVHVDGDQHGIRVAIRVVEFPSHVAKSGRERRTESPLNDDAIHGRRVLFRHPIDEFHAAWSRVGIDHHRRLGTSHGGFRAGTSGSGGTTFGVVDVL
jgi:hypothetical protein